MRELKLTINGKEYNFSFGLGFLGDLLAEIEIDLPELMTRLNKHPLKFIPLMMFRSCEYWNKRNDIKVDFNRYDFADYIQDDGGINTQNVKTFLDAFTTSLTKDVPKDESVPKEKPKAVK